MSGWLPSHRLRREPLRAQPPGRADGRGPVPATQAFPSTYEPGVGSWYNQYVKVDPRGPQHVYVGLEEIYETRDGGARRV